MISNLEPDVNLVCFQIVKQKVELLELITGFETNNKYVIKNAMGQQVYKVKSGHEKTPFWLTKCWLIEKL